MTPPESVFNVNGVDLAVERKGDGLAFFWTHGLLGNRELEEETGVIEWSLLAEKAPLVRYDVRGHGKSGATFSSQDYRWENLAYDAKELIGRLGLPSVIVGGQSMGAVISLFLALFLPECIRGLVLVTPPALWEEGALHGEIYAFAADLLDADGMHNLLSLMQERHDLADRQLLSSPEITKKFVASLVNRDPRVVSAILRGAALTGFPAREKIKEIRVPTLILAWTEDELHPLSAAEELHRLISSSQLYVGKSREDILHWSHLMVSFLAELGAG